MDMTSSDDNTMIMMTPYLHFTGGDFLYFKSLAPSSRGAIAGAAIVLVFLAILERALSAGRGLMEAHWRQAALGMAVQRLGLTAEPAEAECVDCKEEEKAPSANATPIPSLATQPLLASRRARLIAPFIASHDLSRGALYALQALLAYALMLAVMTFQAAYIISIVAGLGLGEMLFGRFALAHANL
ncbi:unnamed protein product [Peniophora sp. CBMAI 1063]|nr:unnamed protein product [Peniophora sp. CBMAI 1063]